MFFLMPHNGFLVFHWQNSVPLVQKQQYRPKAIKSLEP
uniref:Uncharacterized protein n=1 Tax=Anguilla anguilla TaxID=7936 RepID=A0A0E9QZX1_ANGAN